MKAKVLPIIATLNILIALFTASAAAQTKQKIVLEASVPFEFIVGNRTFPAGTYVFEMATGAPNITDRTGVLIVHGKEQKLYAAVATDVTRGHADHAGHKLEFVRDRGQIYLSTIYRHGNSAGLRVHTAPEAGTVEDWEESRVTTVNATLTSGGF